MAQLSETTLMIHGLQVDNGYVRADVFVKKFRTLLQALEIADKFANQGKSRSRYVVQGLSIGSAEATVREKQRTQQRPLGSGVAVLETVANAVYNGDRSVRNFPPLLVRNIQKISDGASKDFSHAELQFGASSVIRIDDFLIAQSKRAMEVISDRATDVKQTSFRGLAIEQFDGILEEMDARGRMLRGKLILSAGGVEIDCIMNRSRIPEAREVFDRRVIVEGTAHYDGEAQLPVRLDVKNIKPIGPADLLRWRGAFKIQEDDRDEEE